MVFEVLLNNARSRGPLWKLAKVQSLLHFTCQYDSVLVFLCHTYKNVLFCFETSKWTKNLIRKGLDSILWLHSVVMSGGSFEDFLTASTGCLEWFSISVITRSSRKLRSSNLTKLRASRSDRRFLAIFCCYQHELIIWLAIKVRATVVPWIF